MTSNELSSFESALNIASIPSANEFNSKLVNHWIEKAISTLIHGGYHFHVTKQILEFSEFTKFFSERGFVFATKKANKAAIPSYIIMNPYLKNSKDVNLEEILLPKPIDEKQFWKNESPISLEIKFDYNAKTLAMKIMNKEIEEIVGKMPAYFENKTKEGLTEFAMKVNGSYHRESLDIVLSHLRRLGYGIKVDDSVNIIISSNL